MEWYVCELIAHSKGAPLIAKDRRSHVTIADINKSAKNANITVVCWTKPVSIDKRVETS